MTVSSEQVVPAVGAELVNPVSGTRTVFLATAASTDGAAVELEQTYPPHSSPPPTHLHPGQDELFTVLAGALHAVVDGVERDLVVGEQLHVPRGTPHQMWNAGDEPAVLRWRTEPALRTDQMHCDLFCVARDHDWTAPPLQLFEVVQRYDEEFRLC